MSPSIRLLRIDQHLADAVAGGEEAFERAYGARLGEAASFAGDIVASSLAFFVRQGAPWGGFLGVDDAGQVVGTCAFKGPPAPDGTIEIAYFTFPPFERRGHATAMASSLFQLAAESGSVRLVIAHTLPEHNASTRALTKLGFAYSGEVMDPEDGPVWRWERPADHR
jgi:RimJ/RimL family protein N-acetyltransferase